MSLRIEHPDGADLRWVALRAALWPFETAEQHGQDLQKLLAERRPFAGFLAVDGAAALGFAEATLRSDYVNGCETRPVAFLEGIYVVPQHRRSGVARALVAAVETWARAQGCTEFASDALIDNPISHATHRALGFQETERVVYFRKPLR